MINSCVHQGEITQGYLARALSSHLVSFLFFSHEQHLFLSVVHAAWMDGLRRQEMRLARRRGGGREEKKRRRRMERTDGSVSVPVAIMLATHKSGCTRAADLSLVSFLMFTWASTSIDQVKLVLIHCILLRSLCTQGTSLCEITCRADTYAKKKTRRAGRRRRRRGG